MESKLGLNFDLVEKARTSAANVAADVQGFIDQHTTVTVERAVCRLLGIDGVNEMDVPMPNVLVDHLLATSLLPAGAAWAIGNAMVETGKDPQGVAEAVDSGELDLSKLPAHSDSEIRAAITPVVNATVERINKNVAKRNAYLKEWGDKEGPYLYIIVATGNIYEDIIQAKAGAKQGADIIAVIRTTGQSLLDYVPYGATTEGFGGTYATQENFRLMRAALDEVGEEQHRYIRLCNYCSGLCMPEIAAMGALERLDVMLNDALYGILFRDINMQRTIVDQYFSRVINGYAGVIINTGEDNYLTTDDAITAAHTVLASQFLNEAFAKDAGMREEQMGLGHAFEMDPSVENTFLYELAQALVLMACACACACAARSSRSPSSTSPAAARSAASACAWSISAWAASRAAAAAPASSAAMAAASACGNSCPGAAAGRALRHAARCRWMVFGLPVSPSRSRTARMVGCCPSPASASATAATCSKVMP